MHLPSLRQLQYFIALSQAGTFYAAAAECHVTQSTLSAGIAELEKTLGHILFERNPKKLDLTMVGQRLLPLALSLMLDAENLVHSANSQREPLTGKLSLGIIPTIAPYLIPHFLGALRDAYPELELTIREDMSARQLDYLKSGIVDVVLMALPYDTGELATLTLWEEPFFFVEKKQQTKMSLMPLMKSSDIIMDNLLLLDDGHCLRDHILSACQLKGQGKGKSTAQKAFGATSLTTLIQMVQHGYGSTLLPAMAIDPHHAPENLSVSRFSDPQPTRTIALVWRETDPRAEEFRLLGGFIKKTGYTEDTSKL